MRDVIDARVIRDACALTGYKDAELAGLLGVSEACLRSWRSQGAPRYVAYALAAVLLGVDPQVILTGLSADETPSRNALLGLVAHRRV